MSTSTNQQAALEKAVVPVAYFVEFQFLSGTSRVSNFNQTVSWNGYDWVGLGSLGSIGAVEESDSLEAKSLTFTLNAAQESWLALAVGPVDEYRGRAAKMWMCPLDENYRLIDTPVLCWTGYMDVVAVGVEPDGEGGSDAGITLKCETAAYGLKRRPPLRLNHAQQQQEHPGDTAFQHLEDLRSKRYIWLTKRFQRI